MQRLPSQTRVAVLSALALVASCSGSSSESASVPARGARTLALDVKESAVGDYASAFRIAKDLGVDDVKISMNWSDLETGSGFNWSVPDTIDLFYPAEGMPVTLVLRPVDTVTRAVPADLANVAFDDSNMIARFDTLLRTLRTRLPRTTVRCIQVGNEVDAFFGADATQWSQYTTFVREAASTIKSLWGSGVHVSTTVTHAGVMQEPVTSYYRTLAQHLDVVSINYYAIAQDFTVRSPSEVAADFERMAAAFPDHMIHLQECGCPSSFDCNSSETVQSDFVRAVFAAWDTHRARIPHIDFAWQHDVASSTVDGWVSYYKASSNPHLAAFRGFLGSLGLRSRDGFPKRAWLTLQDEASKRGW